LAYSTYPWTYTSARTDDRVVVSFSSLPGGSIQNYNFRHTISHQVGHWAGLYHTFEGRCLGSVDYASDTHAEASPAYGCPSGLPLVYNYMDYSYESCVEEFTGGQAVAKTE
ncbi:uncharacterized protein BT62DRAFT_833902, partial [Guyanagaster necrorhizus]